MNDTTRNESTALATVTDPAPYEMQAPGSTALILDSRHFTQMMAVAEIMARGISTVPRHLQKNTGDCLAVVMQAAQWGMNPFAVAQKTHVVSGTLGYEAQLVNAVVNTMSPTKDRINYEWFGEWSKVMGKFEERESKKKVDEDTGKPLKYRVPAWNIKDESDLGVKVWATMKGEDAPRVLTLLLVQCRVRNSPLWADDPRQQIAYLAVKRWVRLHCPDVLMGVYTPDELEERAPARNMGAIEEVRPEVPASLKAAAETAAAKGVNAYQAFWKAAGPDGRKALHDLHASLKQTAIDADKAPAIAASESTIHPDDNPEAGAAEPAKSDAPKVTYATIMEKMITSKTLDALDVACDWIGEVTDPAQRAELSTKYEEFKTALEAKS
jgi:hypothetical protein